jgi:hypothetical protein
MEDRLSETEFSDRMRRRSVTWDIGFDDLMGQVRTVMAIGIWSAHSSSDAEANVPAAALRALRDPGDLELFASLPADLGGAEAHVQRMRLLSAGATARTALHWARLVETARNFLNPNASYQIRQSES